MKHNYIINLCTIFRQILEATTTKKPILNKPVLTNKPRVTNEAVKNAVNAKKATYVHLNGK